jgi:predicted translin family RNA/ssDNA-binding protein
MTRLHDGQEVDRELAEIRRATREFAESLRGEARGDESVGHDALQEAVEACLLAAIVRRETLPSPADLGVEPEIYLLGLGDVVGEIRRIVLRHLMRGDLDPAEAHFALMERLYHVLMRFEAPRAIVALKPKQDTARALVERTRGEVTMARLLHRAHLPAAPSAPEEEAR